jgi:uncharacterized membrane protein YhaH (DUF805 family)
VVRQDVIAKGFEATVDEDNFFLLNSRLHDFGFRGCTSTEQVIIIIIIIMKIIIMIVIKIIIIIVIINMLMPVQQRVLHI